MYSSVIGQRYKAPQTSAIWSYEEKIKTMRLLWIALAENQYQLGVSCITQEGIDEMKQQVDNINVQAINDYEEKFHHDIMAHLQAYCDICPAASSFIHLGATSNYINDNCELILVKKSFKILHKKLLCLMEIIKNISLMYADVPTLAYTHLQKAQLITIGKRFTMYYDELNMVLLKWNYSTKNTRFRGICGTVGSEDTLLELLESREKCKQLNANLASHFGFEDVFSVCNQTYSRSIDVETLHCLSLLCQTIYKIMNDIRLLSAKEEIYEAFGQDQVGSSAMPYKRNPINCEKLCSLCRYVVTQEMGMIHTYMNQWLERSLDDSAIKRIVMPESFLLCEHILDSSCKVIKNLCFDKEKIQSNVQEHIKYIVSEKIILKGVKEGHSRNEVHEWLRQKLLKNEENPILEKLSKNISTNPQDYIGNCVAIVHEYYSSSNALNGEQEKYTL